MTKFETLEMTNFESISKCNAYIFDIFNKAYSFG